MGKYHSFFAPRLTHVIKHAPFQFEDDFTFDDFTVPAGAEEHLFAVFTVIVNDVHVGFTFVNIASILAGEDQGSDTKTMLPDGKLECKLLHLPGAAGCSRAPCRMDEGKVTVGVSAPRKSRISAIRVKTMKTQSGLNQEEPEQEEDDE